MSDVLTLVKEFGPLVAILLFFIWRDYVREQRMTDRIRKIEDYQRDKLESLVTATSNLIKENIEVKKDLIETMDLRPCLHGKVK